MILAVAEDFDGFKTVYSVVDIEGTIPRIIKCFTLLEEAEQYIKTTKTADTVL